MDCVLSCMDPPFILAGKAHQTTSVTLACPRRGRQRRLSGGFRLNSRSMGNTLCIITDPAFSGLGLW